MDRQTSIPFIDSEMDNKIKRENIPLLMARSPNMSLEREGRSDPQHPEAGENHPEREGFRPVSVNDGPTRKRTRTKIDVNDDDLEREERKRNVSGRSDEPDEVPKSEVPDIRGGLYQTKKSVAQGLLDIALLTANASQLKNLIETENHPFYYVAMTLLLISITLQIFVAIMLLVVARMDYEPSSAQRKRDNRIAIILNDIATIGVFLITAVNIFIAAFISHGKAYIPPVDAQASWNEKMYQQQKRLWEPLSRELHNVTLR